MTNVGRKYNGPKVANFLVVQITTCMKDNLAHKIVHTFEKMDAINPTFELIDQIDWIVTRLISTIDVFD